MILPYLKYFFRAGNEHSIHSPFVYELYRDVIRNRSGSRTGFDDLELLRKQLRRNHTEIEVLDLGAGSRIDKSNKRRISQIAKNAEKPVRFGELFYRLAGHFAPRTVVELGTSLGLTTLYFSKAIPGGHILTFEGCPATSAIASENFKAAGAKNIEIVTGNIDETLPHVVKNIGANLDMVYFDANHRYEPTVRYFQTCLPQAGNESVFIFDDIYWSEEMTAAWDEIKKHPAVTVTLDLFWIGLVFFRKEQAKEDFVLRF
ncbi:class I SAM-dependent methyltransferase [Ravibacter arvi]|uniref:Class I SAM-dependent methyltransferase n=1 Tax=Ravibacter arvi TaxID=2051041 RepID=A0ABP8LVY1_9BACT